MSNDLVVVLDLDGTLIAEGDDIAESHEVILRPHLKTFLDFCFAKFSQVDIWSAASTEWVDKVVKSLPRQDFHKVRSGCSKGNTYYPSSYSYYSGDHVISSGPYKNLKKYYNKHRTIIVDNTPGTFRKNYGNAVYIPTFDGKDLTDEGLLDTIDKLNDFTREAGYGSVRNVDRAIDYNLYK